MTILLRLQSALVLLALAATGTPAEAQIDFGRIMRDAQRNQQRGAQEAAASQACDTIKGWVSSVPAASSGMRRPADIMPLIEDSRFRAAFGKTYDQLTIEDFRRMQTDLRGCQRIGNLTPAEMQTASYVLNQGTHASLTRQLGAQRAASDELARLEQELDGLEANEAGLARLGAIQTRLDTLTRNEPGERRRALVAKVQATRDRVEAPVVRAQVQRLVAESQGPAGLAALAAAHFEFARSKLSPAERDPLRQALADRIAQLMPEVVAEERARADAAGGGLAGLEAGAAWLAQFGERYRLQSPQLQDLAALRAEVIARRATEIRAVEPELRSRIAAIRSAPDAAALLNRYFSADEQRDGAARALKSAADQRVAALESVVRDQALFGVQPEHAALTAAAPASARAPAHPAVERCDALAAHSFDPGRQAEGVNDEAIDSPRAIAACAEALKVAAGEGRIHFQHGRALLTGGRQNEAVAAFRRASERGHGGAYAYLGEAYTHGAGGLPKNPKLAEQHFAKALELGFASQAGGGGGVLKDPAELKDRYEYGALVKAVYYGDASAFAKDRLFANLYLVGQAQLLVQECQSIKLSELRDFQAAVTRSQLPANEQALMAQGMNNIVGALQIYSDAVKNPKSLADIGRRQQRIEDAGEYGMRDLVTFVKTYGGCGNPPIERYTRNLRSYMQNLR